MKNQPLRVNLIVFILCIGLISTGNVKQTQGWSSLTTPNTHGLVGQHAIPLMPELWFTFLNNSIQEINDACNYPDAHKDVDNLEGARHYDDSDIPHNDHTAVGGSDDWWDGVISWAIENATRDLTELIKNNGSDADLIYQMGFVCHYAADSTMPFHATSNYDGQMTGNNGVHGKFEELIFQSKSADIFANITVTEPTYIEDPYAATKENIASGFAVVPDYLNADSVGVEAAVAEKNQGAYVREFYKLMNQSIIERISLAVQFTIDLWYTAIINAEPVPTSNLSSEISSSSSLEESSESPSDNAEISLVPIISFFVLSLVYTRKFLKQ